MRNRCALASALAVFGIAGLAQAQFLAVPNATTDTVMTFDPFDGTPLNPSFIIDGEGAGYDFQTPKAAIQVGSEIWVSDQLTDQIARFDMLGNHLGTITGGLDNIRGMAFVNGVVYVANAGSNNGAPGIGLVTFDAGGNFLGNITGVGDPYDIMDYNGELLVTAINTESINRVSYNGAFLGVFCDSDGVSGIDFPQQLGRRGANVLCSGFSPPIGVYEYDPTGAQVNYWAVGNGNRGVYLLGNGNIMFTDGAGVHVLDPNTGLHTTVATGSCHNISLIGGSDEGCLADYNVDGDVNSNDISAFLSAWLDSVQNGNLIADFNLDGAVNSNDISAFLSAWLDAVQNGC